MFEKIQESFKIACSSFAEAEDERERELGEGKRIFVLPSIIGTEEYVTSKYCGLEAMYGSGSGLEEGPSQFMQAPSEADRVSISSRTGSQYGSLADDQDPIFGDSARGEAAFSMKGSSQISTSIPEMDAPAMDFGQVPESALLAQRSPRRRTSSKTAPGDVKPSPKAAPAAAERPSLPTYGEEALPTNEDAIFGGEGEGDTRPKATYTLSFDDIFGEDDKAEPALAADSLFSPGPSATEAIAVLEPKPKQPANLQASLAKILTESPSVGLFEEAKPGSGNGENRGHDSGPSDGRVSPPSDTLGSAAAARHAAPNPALAGVAMFAKEIAKKGFTIGQGDLMSSILSESPSVGLFDDVMASKVAPDGPSALPEVTTSGPPPVKRESLDAALGGAGKEPAQEPVPAPRASIVRDPFALARAMKAQDSDESDGSFSSDDDSYSDPEVSAEPKPTEETPAESRRSPAGSPSPDGHLEGGKGASPPSRAGKEENPFDFNTGPAAKEQRETPQKLPAVAKAPVRAPAPEENPFAAGASDLFGGSKGEGVSGAQKLQSSAFDSLFGDAPSPAARRKSSNLFDDPFAGGSSGAKEAAKASPFGGSDLFTSSSADLFATTEKERRISKGLFDDFLEDDGKKGGGLFD